FDLGRALAPLTTDQGAASSDVVLLGPSDAEERLYREHYVDLGHLAAQVKVLLTGKKRTEPVQILPRGQFTGWLNVKDGTGFIAPENSKRELFCRIIMESDAGPLRE